MTPQLQQTLMMLAQAAGDAVDPWWIIGSTAAKLHGCDPGVISDVDLMMSARDADTFLRRVGVVPRPGTASDRFRSAVFATWREPTVPVEVFGGFELRVAGTWRPVEIATRECVNVNGASLYVPSRQELQQILMAFGRPKDVDRARQLEG